MERSNRRSSAGRHRAVRRNSGTDAVADRAARRSVIRLAACGIIFALAVFIKLLFPGFAGSIGEKLTTAVDYKAALAALGEGISGDKAFTAAIGEAITYAFRGASDAIEAPDAIATDDGGAVDAFAEDNTDATDAAGQSIDTPAPPDISESSPPPVSDEADEAADTASAEEKPGDLTDAIISAFLQTQEGYSDYDLPAGTTYDMPVIGAAFAAPVIGKITSPFGYRKHPTDGSVKFHYGIDIAAEQGTQISAFADGNVLAVGESTTLGKYVMITHDGFETLYAHCSDVHVSSGQAVKMGDDIAAVGDTGNATSFCLHFELKVGGVYVNPDYYLASSV